MALLALLIMALTQHSVTLRDGVVAAIRSALPVESVPTVEPFDGVVNEEMLANHSFRAPAVLVTVLGGDTKARGATVYDHMQLALYIVTRSQGTQDRKRRADQALIIRERIARLLPYAKVNPENEPQRPREVAWANMFDGKVRAMGLTLWAAKWEYMLELPALESLDDLHDFARLWSEIHPPGEVPDTVETDTALAEQRIDLETEP